MVEISILLFLILISLNNATHFNSLKKIAVHVSKTVIRPIATASLSVLLLSGYLPLSVANAAPPAAPLVSLEQSVQNLEGAESRADALQAMADVFEASEAKGLQAKTRYKQVISCYLGLHSVILILNSSLMFVENHYRNQ